MLYNVLVVLLYITFVSVKFDIYNKITLTIKYKCTLCVSSYFCYLFSNNNHYIIFFM